MLEAEARQKLVDDEHLRLLALFYFIDAGMSAFLSVMGLGYMAMGVIFSRAIPQGASEQGPPPALFGWIFGAIGLAFFAVFITLGILKLIAGLQMRKRRSRILCMVVAAITCLGFPYGTVLGVFTLIVLARPSVVKQFNSPTNQVSDSV